MKDFYSVLGLEANCTFEDIKDAYRKLSKKFHPDLNQGDDYFVSRFREVNEAYEVLIDTGKRARYDKNMKAFRPVDEEFKKRQYYRQQAESNQRNAHAAYYRAKSRGANAGITIVLILLGLIVAVYLAESFGHSKKIKTSSGDTVALSVVSATKPHTHHKKHHIQKINNDSAVAVNAGAKKPAATDAVTAESKPAVTVAQPVTINEKKPALLSTNSRKQQPVNQVLLSDNKAADSFPYATYVRPNVTGVVNLRKSNAYSSEIIEKIPANSKVLVLQKGDIYYKVSYNNDIGYVPKWSLRAK